jgi:hypothetical protein
VLRRRLTRVERRLDAAVDEFIELFDNGRFPALEAPDASS